MWASGYLDGFRADAETQMEDTLAFGTMTRGGLDADGLETETFAASFTTPGKVTGRSGADLTIRTVEIGGVERPVISGGIHIPADRPELVPAGMFVRVEAIGPDSPAHLLGRVYKIDGESVKSYQTARRFDVVEV